MGPGIGELRQVVEEGFEDERQVEVAFQVVIGLEAAIGQDEDVLGFEAAGKCLGRPAIVEVGGGGLEPRGLPEDAPEEPCQLTDEEPGPSSYR